MPSPAARSRARCGFQLHSRVAGYAIAVARQQLHELRMNEKLFASDGDFLEDADFAQLLQIARGRLAPSDFLLDDILNAAVGQLENQVDEFVAVDLGGGLLYVLDRR